MKIPPIKLVAVFISIICVLSVGFASALEADEASVSLLWSTQTVFQGDVVSVKITFTSSSADQLTIVGIGLQFDWDPDRFYGPNLSDDPVIVPSFGTYIFNPITIQIPANVSTGVHSYFVGVDGAQGYLLTEFSWDSPALTIQIHSATGKVYGDLAAQFESKLNNATSSNFKNAEAKSLLQQARVEYDLSKTLIAEDKWSEALLHVTNASSILDQAILAEQRGEEQAGEQQTLLLYLAIAAIVVIIALSIIIVVVRKRRKQPEPEEDQAFDQPLETQDFPPDESQPS